MMVHEEFVNRVIEIFREENDINGLAAGGSWITGEIDVYSDIDFVIVTNEKITDTTEKMFAYAKRIGNFLSGFTGEHVGEPRLLVCLYKDPLLHVDLKFVTLEEFAVRIENPVILLDKEGKLKKVIEQTKAEFPYPSYQWIEDRFWIWIHYMTLKLGRGEYMEAYDAFSFLRAMVLGPLMHIRNGNLPKGVRHVETKLIEDDFKKLSATIPLYEKQSMIETLCHVISVYKNLRDELYPEEIIKQVETENEVMNYLKNIEKEYFKL